MDWLDLLAVQGTLNSLLQHNSSKASVLWCSAFPLVQLSIHYSCKSHQFSSVQSLSHVRLCNPMNCSMAGLPVHHQPPKYTQTHFHRVSDAVQPSLILCRPFSSCPQSLPASESFPMSQFFASGGQSIGVSTSTSVLPKNTQD